MNASPLVLSPSGPANTSPSSSVSATATKSARTTGDDSTFAGALRSAGPKPTRKPSSLKVAEGGQTGGALPVAGNQSPQRPAHGPQSDTPTAVVQPAVVATAASEAVTGTPPSVAGTAEAGDPVSGAAADSRALNGKDAVPVSAGSGTSGKGVNGKLNTAFNNLPGMPAAEASGAVASGAVASGAAAPGAAASGTAAPGAAAPGVEAVRLPAAATASVAAAAAADARGAPTTTVMASGSMAAAAKPLVKAPSSTLRPQPATGTNGAAAGIGTGDADPDTAGAGAPAAPAQGAAAAAASNSTAIAAAAAASQAANPTATGDDASGDAAAGSGVAGVGGAAAPATTVALAAARAATTAAASVATAQTAAVLAGADDKHVHASADSSTAGSTGTDAAAGLFQLNPAPTTGSTADVGATPTFQLHPSLDSGDLAQGLSDRVTYMVDNGLNGAKLQVNPPQLGPIELRIAVSGGHAQIWMTAHSAVTRDALESSSPKLREMLGAQGFGQVSVDISQRSFQDRSSQAQPYQRMAAAERGMTASTAVASVANTTTRTSLGALDTYA